MCCNFHTLNKSLFLAMMSHRCDIITNGGKFGQYLYAKTYSAFGYFRLTQQGIRKALDGGSKWPNHHILIQGGTSRDQVGQQVRFDTFENLTSNNIDTIRKKFTGTLVLGNVKHRWFSVAYANGRSRISFRFADIGKSINLI